MKKVLQKSLIWIGIALLVVAYVYNYRLTKEALSVPGAMYCGFLPLGVAWDLTWREEYAWVRFLCPMLILGGIILRACCVEARWKVTMEKSAKVSFVVWGIVLVGVSISITLISTSEVNIIGGAGWPTLRYFFMENAWIANAGVLLMAAGAFIKKKQ
jgi:hypothetical protein